MEWRVQLTKRDGDRFGVEMTAGAGVDLNDSASCFANAFSISQGGLIAFDHGERVLGLQIGECSFEQRCFAGAGRTHDVERQDVPAGEPAAISFRGQVVFRQNVLFHRDRAALRMPNGMAVGMFVAVVMRMRMGMIVMVMSMRIVMVVLVRMIAADMNVPSGLHVGNNRLS
jgi:hypothetical protein